MDEGMSKEAQARRDDLAKQLSCPHCKQKGRVKYIGIAGKYTCLQGANFGNAVFCCDVCGFDWSESSVDLLSAEVEQQKQTQRRTVSKKPVYRFGTDDYECSYCGKRFKDEELAYLCNHE